MKRVYLDYAATTPVDTRVLKAMQPYFAEDFGNPGSLHSFGQSAIAAVDKSREVIARAIGADFREIIFTSGATEANNLALRGAVEECRKTEYAWPPRIIISAVEHESVYETAQALAREGVEVVEIPVSKEGIIDLKKLESALNDRTILVSVMYGNNETGTMQPIQKIAELVCNFRASQKAKTWPLFHTDAAQAFQFLSCNVSSLGVDLLTLSAHKIYGPKGVGVLYVRKKEGKGTSTPIISPVLFGGGQEFSLRSGTENVPSIVGCAAAVELAEKEREKRVRNIGNIRQYVLESMRSLRQIRVHGSKKSNEQLPHIVNMYIKGFAAEEVLMQLDMLGVAASAGSACKARSFVPSRVIQAMGGDLQEAKESIRLSFGANTKKSEVEKALSLIKKIIKTQ